MGRVRYIGQGPYAGPSGSWSPQEEKEVPEPEAGRLLKDLPEWFEAVKPVGAPAKPPSSSGLAAAHTKPASGIEK